MDSKSSIAISESLKTGSNVGHVMMRISYIYLEVLAKTVEVKYINTHNQVADILTKRLALEQYAVLSGRLFREFNGVPVTHESSLYVPAKVRAKTLEAESEEPL
jgi:hypothetical protein